VLNELRRRGLFEDRATDHLPTTARPTRRDDARERNKQSATRIWRETVPLLGTPAERYFVEHRKLDVRRLNLSHALRWHAAHRMVVALMTDAATNKPRGVHRTLLNRDGSKLDRKMLGPAGVIRLTPDDMVFDGLGLVEGIEDGLAILLAGWAPVWVGCSASGINNFPTLNGIEALTIFADADAAGQNAAHACAERWRKAGADVTVRAPSRRVRS
jgi:hypothetical protein